MITLQSLHYKLQATGIVLISEHLLSLGPYMPWEFVREPRSLHDTPRLKAIEFRQLILYTSIVVLMPFLSDDHYYHLLLFHCRYYFLLSKQYYNHIDVAEEMFHNFVEHFTLLYRLNKII